MNRQTLQRWLWQAPLLLLVTWLAWGFFNWGVLRAVFTPDLAACQALERTGACWGVVASKGQAWFLGTPSTTGQWDGLPLTLLLTITSLVASVPLALCLALGRLSGWRVLSWPATACIETIRGAPLVMWLFAAAFVLPALLNRIGPAGWEPGIVPRVWFVLSIFSAAYMAEILRGSLQVVSEDQAEAAQALGASWWMTQWQVILPQVFRRSLPSLTGHAIGVLKDTSLVTIVSLQDLSGAMTMSLNGDADWRPFFLEAYLVVALVYAAMCLAIAAIGQLLEKRYPAMDLSQ